MGNNLEDYTILFCYYFLYFRWQQINSWNNFDQVIETYNACSLLQKEL